MRIWPGGSRGRAAGRRAPLKLRLLGRAAEADRGRRAGRPFRLGGAASTSSSLSPLSRRDTADLVTARGSVVGVPVRLRGEGAVSPREPVSPPAVLEGVPGPRVFRQGDHRVAGRAAHPVRETRRPTRGGGPHPEGVTGSVRAVDKVAWLRPRRDAHLGAAIRAAHLTHDRRPRSRWSRPRSNPTTTSPSTVMTGTAMRPVRVMSSSRAVRSSATFFATNGTP